MAGMTIEHSESSPDVDAAVSQQHAVTYWSSVDSSVAGMLGGYPYVSRVDLQSSANFLVKLRRRRAHRAAQAEGESSSEGATPTPIMGRAVDCGAGIGRITHGLLLQHFEIVDVVEPIAKFTAALAAAPLQPSAIGKLGHIYRQGLESFQVPDGTLYDCIWCQWCLGHLTDNQLVDWLRRCGTSLALGGWIIIKENLSTNFANVDEFDEIDSSVTRSLSKWERCFADANLTIVATEQQRGFPKTLLPVRIWALQPI